MGAFDAVVIGAGVVGLLTGMWRMSLVSFRHDFGHLKFTQDMLIYDLFKLETSKCTKFRSIRGKLTFLTDKILMAYLRLV